MRADALLKNIEQLLSQNPHLYNQTIEEDLTQLLNQIKSREHQHHEAVLELLEIKRLIPMNFYVDRYQRSYKWTKQQVTALLNDIHHFRPQGDSFYCLQPVVVKKHDKDGRFYWELIDGQQRTTTIYLVLTYLQYNCYQLSYNTRQSSQKFLENLSLLGLTTFDSYEKFIETYPDLDNIDNFHFFNAYQAIHVWFTSQNENIDFLKKTWLNKLLQHTKVIWYQVKNETHPSKSSQQQSIEIFQRLNQGKIALTNAELIKALFLHHVLDEQRSALSKIKQIEMANQWDFIEYTLQNDEFWSFLSPHQQTNKYTRIELIFDLISAKFLDEKNNTDDIKFAKKQEFYTFHFYAQKLDAKSIEDKNYIIKTLWKEIQQGFYRLKEWFDDDDTYHLIGFILGQKIKTVPQLWALATEKNLTRSAFKQALKLIIAEKVCKNFGEKYKDQNKLIFENIYYGEHNQTIIELLILMNIRLHQAQGTRLSFRSYYQQGVTWSLEHIHAQKDKNKEYDEEIWYREQQDLLSDLSATDIHPPQQKELYHSLQKWVEDKTPVNINEYNALKQQYLEDYLNDLLHQLSNLCLLNKNHNSALGNMPFHEKRQKVIELQSEGKFIPLVTQWVFAKYFNKDAEHLSIWSMQDRLIYKKALIECFESFYPHGFESADSNAIVHAQENTDED